MIDCKYNDELKSKYSTEVGLSKEQSFNKRKYLKLVYVVKCNVCSSKLTTNDKYLFIGSENDICEICGNAEMYCGDLIVYSRLKQRVYNKVRMTPTFYARLRNEFQEHNQFVEHDLIQARDCIANETTQYQLHVET